MGWGSDDEGDKATPEEKEEKGDGSPVPEEKEAKKEKRRRRRMMDDGDEAKAQEKPEGSRSKPTNTGWGSPTAKSVPPGDGLTKIGGEGEEEDEDQPRGRRKNLKEMEEEQETELIMMIPDLDEDESEDITLQVAAAPRNLARRLQSLQQLDYDIKYTVPSSGDLDLSFLTSSIVPPSMVHEEDIAWNFDSLLQEVTQEYTAQAERLREDEKENMIEAIIKEDDAQDTKPGARRRAPETTP